MDFTIRPAIKSDVFAIRNLAELTFRDTYEAYNSVENMESHVAKNFGILAIEKELSNTENQYFIIESDGEAIAYCKLVLNHIFKGLENYENIEIERFYVKKEFKAMNIGRKMMDFCKNWATENGFGVIWLGVWEKNPDAIAFYKKMGFEMFESHKFVLGEEVQNDYIMKQNL